MHQPARLFTRDGGIRVIPDDMLGAADFLGERELRIDHVVGLPGRDPRAREQPLPLNIRRAGDRDDEIAQDFASGLEQEWYVGKEKIGRLAVGSRLSTPLAANARMENLFKNALLSSVLKYYRPKLFPIQVASRRIYRQAEGPLDCLFDLYVVIDQGTGGVISIKEDSSGVDDPQRIAKFRFAGSYPSGNANGGHLTEDHAQVFDIQRNVKLQFPVETMLGFRVS